MRAPHSVLKRGAFYWDQEAFPERVFRERLARVQAAVAASGHDAWLVYGDAQRYGDPAYLTHFLPRARGALLLVPREGEAAILVSVGSRDIPCVSILTWLKDVLPYTRLPGDAAKLVRERGLERGRIGLVGVEELLSLGEWEELQRLLPDVRWEPADDTLARLRVAKDAVELSALQRAAEIARAGLESAPAALVHGRSEHQGLAEIDRRMRAEGAEDTRLLIAAGPRVSDGLRPPDHRLLQPNDVVLLFVAVEWQRYWAEAGQTFTLEEPDATTRELAAAASGAVAAMTAAARPGVAAHSVSDAATACLQAAAPLLRGQDPAISAAYGLGHGIGLDPEEPPYLRAGDTTPLVEGATLALHVVLHGAVGRGALATATIRVGAGGAEPIGEPLPALVERARAEA